MEFLAETWGTGARLDGLAPSEADDPEFRAWYAKLERLAASPNQIRILQKLIGEYDVRSVLPSIRVPTLVMHRRDDSLIDPRHSQYIADSIPGAKLVMLEGSDNLMVAGDSDAHHRRDRGVPHRGPPGARSRPRAGHRDVHRHRRLDSAGVGDRRPPLARAAGEARRARAPQAGLLERARDQDDGRRLPGHVRRPGPGDPCAKAIAYDVSSLGVAIRAGLHTGECEVRGDDVAGMAVHIGARVGAMAGPGEVLVSSTVKDLVVGSGIDFSDQGEHELKGVPGEWRVYRVV